MTDKIEDLLHRRNDLSTFLVHLTRDHGDRSASENLMSILRSETIEAVNALGMARTLDSERTTRRTTQKVACFSEVPLEHTWMMARPIEKRKTSLAPYGVVFSKTTCRRMGANPVWYLDTSVGHRSLTKAVRTLVDAASADDPSRESTSKAEKRQREAILELTPFIEQMGRLRFGRKEFSWEREWRHAGDFAFAPNHVVAVFAPEAEHTDLENEIADLSDTWSERMVPLLDPGWGLERMVAALARMQACDVGPWPA